MSAGSPSRGRVARAVDRLYVEQDVVEAGIPAFVEIYADAVLVGEAHEVGVGSDNEVYFGFVGFVGFGFCA